MDENEAESRYRKLVLADGRVVGAILVGHTAEAAGVTAAVREARDVTPFVAALERGDWSVFAEGS